MKGASVEVAIWSFFSQRALYFHHAKNQPPLRPPSTFSEHWPKFWEYLLSEKFMKFFWYKIWVATIPKNAKFLVWWVYWRRNKGLVLPTFCTLENPLTLLTNCALMKLLPNFSLWVNGIAFTVSCHPMHWSKRLLKYLKPQTFPPLDKILTKVCIFFQA